MARRGGLVEVGVGRSVLVVLVEISHWRGQQVKTVSRPSTADEGVLLVGYSLFGTREAQDERPVME